MLFGLHPVAIGIIGTIIAILLAALALSFGARRQYKQLLDDIERQDNRTNGIFEFRVNNKMVEDYKAAIDSGVSEVNAGAIVDKHLHGYLGRLLVRERFVSKSISLMIVLGLVGTFFGLTLSIAELVGLLTETENAVVGDVGSITGGLLSAIEGMSVAFVTSLFGIAASIIVNILNVFIGIPEYREGYMMAVEEYLDNHLGRKGFAGADTSGFERTIGSLSEEMTTSMQEITSALNYRLTVVSNDIATAAEAIDRAMDRFEGSLNTFADNTRDFSEFNHHLRSNIQRMSLTFEDFTEDLKADRSEETVETVRSERAE